MVIMAFPFGAFALPFMLKMNMRRFRQTITKPNWNDNPFTFKKPLSMYQFMAYFFIVISFGLIIGSLIQFQSVQDRCEMLDTFNVGDMVEVFFNLRGREWTNPQGEVKVFNTLDAWKLEASAAAPAAQSVPEAANLGSSQEDDLPF